MESIQICRMLNKFANGYITHRILTSTGELCSIYPHYLNLFQDIITAMLWFKTILALPCLANLSFALPQPVDSRNSTADHHL